MKLKKFFYFFLPLVLSIGFSWIFFKPLVKGFSSKIPDDYDGLLITWSLNRVAQNFSFNLGKVMEGNIFYPYKYTHAFSDPFITDGLLASPIVKLIGEPITAFNFNLFLSQALFIFFTYLFLTEILPNRILGFLLSLIFSFSSIRLHYLGHLQMFSLYWVPLAGYSLIRFSRTKRILWLILFFFAFLAQVLNSFLPGYFIIFLAVGLFLINPSLREALRERKRLVGVLILAIGVLAWPLARIYLTVSSSFNYVRPIRDVIHFSLSPEEILTKFFSPVLLIIFVFSLVIFTFVKAKKNKGPAWLIFAFLAFVLVLGPVFHWFGKTVKVPFFGYWLPIPLPYLVLYYLAPGFKGFRTPSRWIFMAGFFLIAFSMEVIGNFLKRADRSAKFFLFGFLLICFFLSFKPLETYYTVPVKSEYPPVYKWLEKQPDGVIVEIPIYYWGDLSYGKREVYRMLYSLEHGKKMINGYSGFSPPEWEKMVIGFRNDLLLPEELIKIEKMGVNFLVVHEDEFKDLWPDDYSKRIDFLKNDKEIKEVFREGSDVIYSF